MGSRRCRNTVKVICSLCPFKCWLFYTNSIDEGWIEWTKIDLVHHMFTPNRHQLCKTPSLTSFQDIMCGDLKRTLFSLGMQQWFPKSQTYSRSDTRKWAVDTDQWTPHIRKHPQKTKESRVCPRLMHLDPWHWNRNDLENIPQSVRQWPLPLYIYNNPLLEGRYSIIDYSALLKYSKN